MVGRGYALSVKRFAMYGSRRDGHAKVCMGLARRLGFECVAVLDDFSAEREAFGLPLAGGVDALPRLRELGAEAVALGFGSGPGRRALVAPIRAAGLDLLTLVDPDARIDDSATIGPGAVVLRGALVGEDSSVGEAALINAGAVLTHDVRVEAAASVGPGAVLAGRARVCTGAELGAGAVLLPDAVVEEGAVVAAGAVVTGSVEPGVTVAGVPARVLA